MEVPKRVIEEAIDVCFELKMRTRKCGNQNDDWEWWLKSGKTLDNLKHYVVQDSFKRAEVGDVDKELDKQYGI